MCVVLFGRSGIQVEVEQRNRAAETETETETERTQREREKALRQRVTPHKDNIGPSPTQTIITTCLY